MSLDLLRVIEILRHVVSSPNYFMVKRLKNCFFRETVSDLFASRDYKIARIYMYDGCFFVIISNVNERIFGTVS